MQELAAGVDNVLRKHGRDIAEMQYTQKRTADMAIDLYAIAACISRTTRAIERRGEEGARREIDLTNIFVRPAERRLARRRRCGKTTTSCARPSPAAPTPTAGYPFDVSEAGLRVHVLRRGARRPGSREAVDS